MGKELEGGTLVENWRNAGGIFGMGGRKFFGEQEIKDLGIFD